MIERKIFMITRTMWMSFGRRKKVWHSIYFKRRKIIQKRNGMAVKHNNLSLINRIYLVVVATKYRVERNIKKIHVKFQVSKNNMKFIRRIKNKNLQRKKKRQFVRQNQKNAHDRKRNVKSHQPKNRHIHAHTHQLR